MKKAYQIALSKKNTKKEYKIAIYDDLEKEKNILHIVKLHFLLEVKAIGQIWNI